MHSAVIPVFLILCLATALGKTGKDLSSTRTVREGASVAAIDSADVEVDAIGRDDRQVYGTPVGQISQGGYADVVGTNTVGAYGVPVVGGASAIGGYGVPQLGAVGPAVSIVKAQVATPLIETQSFASPGIGYGGYGYNSGLGYSSSSYNGGFGSHYNGGFRGYGDSFNSLYSHGSNYYARPIGYGNGYFSNGFQQPYFRPYLRGFNYQRYYRYQPFTASYNNYNHGLVGGVSGGYS